MCMCFVVEDSSTLQDTSNASVCSDEGLDVSQRFSEALFSGLHLESDAEEMVTGMMANPMIHQLKNDNRDRGFIDLFEVSDVHKLMDQGSACQIINIVLDQGSACQIINMELVGSIPGPGVSLPDA